MPYSHDGNDNIFLHQRTGSPAAFAQYFNGRFFFDVLDRDGAKTLTFSCTVCHRYQVSGPLDVRIHACTMDTPTRSWHFVQDCVAVVCKGCVDRFGELFLRDRVRCINCRSHKFYNGYLQQVSIVGQNPEKEAALQQHVQENRQNPGWRKNWATSWDSFCAKGNGFGQPMKIAMAQVRAYTESAGTAPTFTLPYWEYEYMKEVQGTNASAYQVPSDLKTVKKMKLFYTQNLRHLWSVSKWYYSRADLFAHLFTLLPGLAAQCPQNQWQRDHLVAPVHLNQQEWMQFTRLMDVLAERIGTNPPGHFMSKWEKPNFHPDIINDAPKPSDPEPFNPALDDEDSAMDSAEEASPGLIPADAAKTGPIAPPGMEL